MSCGRLLIGVVVATGTLALASACGGSGYQYVENEDRGVFARLPDDWTVYDTEDLFALQNPDASDEAEPSGRLWYRGFDADEKPSIERINDQNSLASAHPQGLVVVKDLTSTEREQVNLSTLRGLFFGGDPLASMQQAPDGSVQVIDEEPVDFDGGYHGVHTLVALGASPDTAIVDQTVLLNKTSSTAYLFVVACSDRCYSETHKDEIAKVVDSWTIEEDGS
jgi:hypothetical protein